MELRTLQHPCVPSGCLWSSRQAQVEINISTAGTWGMGGQQLHSWLAAAEKGSSGLLSLTANHSRRGYQIFELWCQYQTSRCSEELNYVNYWIDFVKEDKVCGKGQAGKQTHHGRLVRGKIDRVDSTAPSLKWTRFITELICWVFPKAVNLEPSQARNKINNTGRVTVTGKATISAALGISFYTPRKHPPE